MSEQEEYAARQAKVSELRKSYDYWIDVLHDAQETLDRLYWQLSELGEQP
jgi:hypothetical protein